MKTNGLMYVMAHKQHTSESERHSGKWSEEIKVVSTKGINMPPRRNRNRFYKRAEVIRLANKHIIIKKFISE